MAEDSVAPASDRIENRRVNYDLDDDEADLAKWPALRNLLQVLRENLLPMYHKADEAAQRRHRRHHLLVWCAAVCGTLAVLCAIVEPTEILPVSTDVVGRIELIAAAAAIIAVGIGLWSTLHPEWLLQRFCSEQCRFIKFHLLLNPAEWYGKTEDKLRSVVERLIEPLQTPQGTLMHDWVLWKQRLSHRFLVGIGNLPESDFVEVLDYYKQKRLLEQKRYFDQEATKRHHWESWTRFIPPWLFFLSITAAFLHFVCELLAHRFHFEWLETVAAIGMLLAAMLPAIAAGVRTVRSAHEYGRNQLRFKAMSNYLMMVLSDVSAPATSATILAQLREAETTLETEHRAWLHLMLEAEWFG